jgi:hypothetical protein
MTTIDELIEKHRSARANGDPAKYLAGISVAEAHATAAALTSLQERSRKLEEAARAFVAKFDECKPHIDDAFVHRQMRVGEYKGPQVDEELAALRALLSGCEG